MKVLKMFLPALFVISIVPACFAEKIDYPENLWKGLIGEAANQGYKVMYAAACVYRNRTCKHMPLGCVAMKRPDLNDFVKRQGKKYEKMAKEIMWKVFIDNGPDVTNGATHYENVKKFGFPYWATNMEITAQFGSHTFFKEKQ